MVQREYYDAYGKLLLAYQQSLDLDLTAVSRCPAPYAFGVHPCAGITPSLCTPLDPLFYRICSPPKIS